MPAKTAPVATKKAGATKKKTRTQSPLFVARPRSSRIGGDLRPQGRDLSRFVRWPKYVRLQRQKKVLLQRLKLPPSLHQFSHTLDKNQAAELFKLLIKYKPETKEAKLKRLEAAGAAAAASKTAGTSTAVPTVKCGLKHVTSLIEKKKAKLVVIAHDVDPIELVLWLPALCRKMDVPFAIVKGKARLGTLTNMKTASCLALTKVNKEDEAKLKQLSETFHAQFNEVVERKWREGVMGLKTQTKLEKRRQQIEAERQKKLEAQR